MHNASRCREKIEGRIGRYRIYTCRVPGCGKKFRAFTLNPLPEKDRICPDCREEKYE